MLLLGLYQFGGNLLGKHGAHGVYHLAEGLHFLSGSGFGALSGKGVLYCLGFLRNASPFS